MEISLRLENKNEELDRLTDWVKEVSQTLNLTRQEEYVLRLALEEIVTNVMKYAYGEGVDLPIDIRCSQVDARLEITVEDQGPAFNPLEADPPTLSLNVDERKEGGLGIHIVRKVIDNVQYNRDQGRNKLTLFMTPGSNKKCLSCCGTS